jgi:hypothetical protein
MAIYKNSYPFGSIVRSGLVLSLDATNYASYPGNGNVWYDTSGNGNNGTFVSGAYNDMVRGRSSVVFDGVNDYVGLFPIQLSDTGSKTILAFVKPNSSVRMGVCGTRNGSNTSGFVFCLNRTTPGNLTYFHTGFSTAEIAGNIQTGSWYQVGVTYDKTLSEVKLYVNGSQIGNTVTSFLPILNSNVSGSIGSEDGGTTCMSGSISAVQIYNRALSSQEVQQNYNALKSRFGL